MVLVPAERPRSSLHLHQELRTQTCAHHVVPSLVFSLSRLVFFSPTLYLGDCFPPMGWCRNKSSLPLPIDVVW